MEFTQENFDKLLKIADEVENYKKAVTEERTRRKATQDELTSANSKLEDIADLKEEQTKREKKLKDKFDKELAEKEEKIKELSEATGGVSEKATKYDEMIGKLLEEKLTKIPEEKLEFVKKLIGEKPYEEQSELLDGFIADYSKPDFKAKPKDGDADPKDTSDYEKAKQEGNRMDMLAHAPKVPKQENI